MRSDRGTMALTWSQVFLGALTMGIGLSRGIEADLGFLGEDLTGEANYGASRLAAGHAHAENAIADDNVLSAAAMAPRLAVEADNITMDANAAIACGTSAGAPGMAEICAAYTANKPRALAKLAWIREKQTSLWGSLEQLSGSMDKVAGAHGQEDISKTIAGLDPTARVRYDDPTMSRDTWTGRNATTGCSLASKDALASPMTGHAFPLLMPNLLAGLPQALVAGLPALCPSAGMPGSGQGAKPMTLPQVPAVQEKADKKCGDSRAHMRDQVAHSQAKSGDSERPEFSSDVDSHMKCTEITPTKRPPKQTDSDAFVVRRGGKVYSCTFDQDDCKQKALEEATADYLKKLGLPTTPSFSAIGGSTRAPGALNMFESNDFRAAVSVSRSMDSKMAEISDSARTLMSFGRVDTPTHVLNGVQRTSTGKWYFPQGAGSFAGVPADQQPFTRAYRHALVASHSR